MFILVIALLCKYMLNHRGVVRGLSHCWITGAVALILNFWIFILQCFCWILRLVKKMLEWKHSSVSSATGTQSCGMFQYLRQKLMHCKQFSHFSIILLFAYNSFPIFPSSFQIHQTKLHQFWLRCFPVLVDWFIIGEEAPSSFCFPPSSCPLRIISPERWICE